MAGAEQVFAEAHVGVSHELAAAVTERTEGWPVGLYLAAVIARHDRDQGLTVSGDDRYVADYLYRESLMLLPKKTQRFLRRTAVLDQLCAPLCDAVLGESGGQERLRALEASNSFLIPLDRRREWFRYHALYREFLLGELRRVEPEVIMKLHLRAADWYESNGSPALAIEHLLNTTERDRCVQLVTELVLPTYNAGQMSTVQRWLSALGDSAVEAYPPLAVLAGWVTALTGQTAAAERWAAIVDAASFDQVPLDGTASFDSARAMLRAVMCASGPEQMMVDANVAVAQEPPWSPWRDTALLLAAHAHLLAGDVDEARVLFAEAVTRRGDASATPTRSSTARPSSRCWRWITGGGPRRPNASNGLSRSSTSIGCTTTRSACSPSPWRLALRCTAAIWTRRTDSSPGRCGPVRRARSCCPSSRCAPGCSSPRRTRHEATRPPLAISCERSTSSCSTGRPWARSSTRWRRSARRWQRTPRSERPARHPLTGAELRLLPYLQTHLTIGEIGERLFVSRNTVSSEVASIYRKLGVSSRNDAVRTGDQDRPARRLTAITHQAGSRRRRRRRARAPAPASGPPQPRTAARRPE